MVFEVGRQIYESVQTVLEGKVNNVYVCRELGAPTRTYYTLLEIKDRIVAKQLVECLSTVEKPGFCKRSFTHHDHICFLLDHRTVRPMEKFFMGAVRSRFECEELVLKVVMECLDQAPYIPFPLMKMTFNQKNVNLSQDNSVYFTYNWDFTYFEPDCDEANCTAALASLLARLLRQQQGVRGGAFELIERKIHRDAYSTCSELYHDIRVTAVPKKKLNLWKRIKRFFVSNKDRLFRILMVLCVVLVILAILSLISHLVFGESFFRRIFFNSFEIIGTESMLIQ
ncbi:MAG: hypothetical protein R3Y62_00630 [Eubacteriales bacterium]